MHATGGYGGARISPISTSLAHLRNALSDKFIKIAVRQIDALMNSMWRRIWAVIAAKEGTPDTD